MEGMPEICGLNHAAAKLFQGHHEIWDSTMVVLWVNAPDEDIQWE